MLLFSPPALAAPTLDWRVVRTYPHDPTAFTEGLFWLNGALFESTGLEGASQVRREDLETGRVLQAHAIDPRYFGEGIVAWKGRLIELTWQSHIGFVYDLPSFRLLSTFHYPGEGWALTQDGRRLIMSDGTATLRLLDPVTLKQTGRIDVTEDGQPVTMINELEWVHGRIFANIWQTDRIAIIDPASGHVTAWLDLTNLLGEPHGQGQPGQPDVLNGIAYDAARDRLFVTGKLWPRLYQIRLARSPP